MWLGSLLTMLIIAAVVLCFVLLFKEDESENEHQETSKVPLDEEKTARYTPGEKKKKMKQKNVSSDEV